MYSNAQKDQWYLDYVDGMSLAAIGEKYGVNYRTLKAAISFREQTLSQDVVTSKKLSSLEKVEMLMLELEVRMKGTSLKEYLPCVDRYIKLIPEHAKLTGEYLSDHNEGTDGGRVNVAATFTVLMERYVKMSDEQFANDLKTLKKGEYSVE